MTFDKLTCQTMVQRNKIKLITNPKFFVNSLKKGSIKLNFGHQHFVLYSLVNENGFK